MLNTTYNTITRILTDANETLWDISIDNKKKLPDSSKYKVRNVEHYCQERLDAIELHWLEGNTDYATPELIQSACNAVLTMAENMVYYILNLDSKKATDPSL